LVDSDNLQDVMGETLAAGSRRLPRTIDLSGSGVSNSLPIGVLGHGSGALLGGVQSQPAMSPSLAPAAGAPSVSASGSRQAVPLVSTPAGSLGWLLTRSAIRSSRSVRFTGQTGTDSRVAPYVPMIPKQRCARRSYTTEAVCALRSEHPVADSRVGDQVRQQGIQPEIAVVQEGPSCRVAADHPVAVALAETVEAVTGRCPAFEMCPGLQETRWYVRKGIPAFAYGPGFLEVAHGPKESVEVERICKTTVIYALMAARLLG
jgi:hypothetical protein